MIFGIFILLYSSVTDINSINVLGVKLRGSMRAVELVSVLTYAIVFFTILTNWK